MSSVEVAVIIIGLLLGYWLVSALGSKKPPPLPQLTTDSFDGAVAKDTSWEHVLCVLQSASLDEIHEAYRLQISQYHPDKVSSLGEDLRALAEKRTRQIDAAYNEALSLRGVST